MKPTKNPAIRRLAHIPAETLGRILGDAPGGTNYYVMGVEQSMPGASHAGMFYSVAAILELSIAELFKQLVDYLSSREILEIVAGTPADFYQNTIELIAAITSIRKIPGVIPLAVQKIFEDILAEFAADTRNIYVFVFDASTNHLTIPGILSGGLRRVDNSRKYALVSRRDSGVNPIINADVSEYFRLHSSIAYRSFSRGHPASQGIELVLGQVLAKDTKLFFSGNIPGEYTSTHILLGITHRVYATILSRGDKEFIYAAIPFEDSKIFSNVPVISSDDVFRDAEKYPWELLNEYLTKTDQEILGLWTIFDDKWAAAVTPAGPHWFGVKNGLPVIPGVQIKKLDYDPREINKTIMSADSPKDKSDELAARAFYNNYLYRLFVGEFIRSLDNERDHETRIKIYDLIAQANFSRGLVIFKEKLQQLIPAEDFSKIVSQISELILAGTFSKKRLRAALENTAYTFDRLLFKQLEQLTHAEATIKIRETAKNFAVNGQIGTGEFPNIYLGCSDNAAQIYCKDSKLICERPVEELADLLAGDLASPLMRRYILESATPYVNFFKFQEHLDELISIKILV